MMNCEQCQELLSEFIDGELREKVAAEVETHLSLCAECAELHEDFAGILGFCEKKGVTEETAPPNAQAMWCRINNVIEAEIKPEIVKESEQVKAKNRIWSFSFSQIATALVGIAIISSLLTFIGIKNVSEPSDISSSSAQSQTLFEKVLSKVGLADTPKQARERRIREQQAAIDYWNKRVEARRTQWTRNLREAFDRNLQEIDQVVNEYTQILEENPQDDLSSEMLDSALNEKMN
ncbi:MAG TPA: zf-HC2 domain-containing protein, partial [Pyrinomonadaceae bacterium]|nr:zf-HC2 domain-containing protein [Pyrinomonadaceae bacterium]